MGLTFYLTSLLIDTLVDGDISLGLTYAGIMTASLCLTLSTRHFYQIKGAEVFVILRQGLSGLLYKKSVRLGLRSISE